jgi:hypothetical protein
VPLSVDTCRCGAARPDDALGATTAIPPDVPSTAEPETGGLPKWVVQLGGLVAVLGVYFGSRSCNRWQTSREVRAAAVEALSGAVGAESAEKLVTLHHLKCFDETYQTGWGRRQASKFDEEKYVQCIVRGIEKDGRSVMRQAAVLPPESVATRLPVATPPMAAQPPPTTPSTPEPDYGRLTLGDFKLQVFKKQPNLQLAFTFAALGQPAAILHKGGCSIDVECGGQGNIPIYNERALTECPLQVDGLIGKGSVATSWVTAAPAEGTCRLRFALTRNSQLTSNEMVVELQETH